MLTLYGLEMLFSGSNLSSSMLYAIRALVVSIRIMAEKLYYKKYGAQAHTFACSFVDKCRRNDVFGAKFVVMMVHLLEHLGPDTFIHGPLETISAFRFENTLKSIKERTRSSKNPLANITKKLKVSCTFVSKCRKTYTNKQVMSRQLPSGRYATLATPDWYLSITAKSSANAYFSTRDGIWKFNSVEMRRRDSKIIVHAYRYRRVESAYDLQYIDAAGKTCIFNSGKIGIWKVADLSTEREKIALDCIMKKYVVHDFGGILYAYAMISLS
jgi:hypothetical protein